jgi:pimeloyl-ACP methyl ester carboxylesterase
MAVVNVTTSPGLRVTDHRVDVPVDWARPDGETLQVFAREVVDPAKANEDLPLLLFLQGGPGGKGPRPQRDGWLPVGLRTHRVVLLDQRGTGRSSRVDGADISRFADPAAAAAYLRCFRADSIVADAEHLRTTVYGGRRWETLGQSYGGFITLTYLSQAPQGLAACYVTGGLASLEPSAAEVYRRTYPRVAARVRRFYDRYPADADLVAAVADHVAASDVRLPDGDRLTVHRLQALGGDLGMAPGVDELHWLFDEAWADERRADRLSETFCRQVAERTAFADNPLFVVMQESIYGHGADGPATGWAAAAERERHPEFAETARPLTFTGEMMFPWMFSEIRALRPFEAAAHALATTPGWSDLYDHERLAANDVPVAAVVYHDDVYVDAGLSLRTAEDVGNCEAWVTNEYEHDGLRRDPAVLERLLDRIRDRGGPLTG